MIIEIENMKCGGCANTIKNALLKFDGINQVDVNLENNQVMIDSSEGFDVTPILDKLAQMGYPQKGNNTLMSKAISYVSCMIGKIETTQE